MRIVNSEFKISVASVSGIIRDGMPQIAFVGRSNVGKSSLLNMLTNRKGLAITSSTPGRTRLINYFTINKSFYFVDLPGYGYAKASKSKSEAWQALIEPYLVKNQDLKCVCVLVDIRHKPSDLDKLMCQFLEYHHIPFIIVATKADKLSRSKVKPEAQKIANELGVGVGNIYTTSSSSKLGQAEVLAKLDQFLEVE